MKFMKQLFSKSLICIPVLMLCTSLLAVSVMAETYTATTMRLLHYEGSVEIEDSSGKSSLVMENIRFNSGDSLHTGASSSASVGLDSTKIVTLDQNTKVQFTKQSNAMKLSLSQGSFFLDVSEKLGDGESLDIKTSTMTVGIRGTVVLLSTYPIDEYQNLLSRKTASADGQAADGQAAGTETVSLSSLEEKIMQASSSDGGVVSVIGVLEGTVEMDYQDESGKNTKLKVSGGQKATLLDSNENGMADLTPEVNKVTPDDLFDAADKQIQQDQVLQRRLQNAGFDLPGNSESDSSYPAKGDWTITSPVMVVAQSASKMFDGSPLSRSTDVLVEGLPDGLTCRATAGGSRTDAGSGDNPISSCVIYNRQGENVTSHFTNIQKVSGKLTIDPAPLTAWSGSATKVYDGTPLTSTETKLTFSPGYEKISYARKNLSYVITEKASVSRKESATDSAESSAAGNNASAATAQSPQSSHSSNQSEQAQSSPLNESQTLYGICGTVLVHGSNPLTEEIKEINLSAGQRLTVYLSDKDQEESIEYVIETITEDEVPEDILRIYADNPEILTQACTETNWNIEKLTERIKLLPPDVGTNSDVNGVKVNTQTTDNLMEDCTNVRITIDTEITNYNNRALNKEEAHYTPMKADPSIKIVPNASITDVGTINNTFTIDWGSAHKDNYKLSEQYGTLTVTPAPASVTTGSAEKEYDGTPLTNSEASISGLVHGETASVTATGSITNVGSKSNSYTIDWGSTKAKNYDVSSNTGTLKVTASKAEVSIRVSVSGKTYDGKPLDIDTVVTSDDSVETASKQVEKADVSDSTNKVTVEGLPAGFTFKAHITGSRTDAGSSELTIESYEIFDEDGKDVTDHFSNVEIVESTLTIAPAPVTVTTGSASKEYDGTALTSDEAAISGLVDADKDTVKVAAAGSIIDVGTTENSYTIDWGEAKSSNYTLSENIGTLEVTENSTEITFKAPSDSKTYDGIPLSADDAGAVTAEGLPEGITFSASASGSQTDAGSSESTVDSFKILNADEKDVTAYFSNIKTEKGTLTVNQADAAVTTGSASREYDGKELTNSEASISGLADTDKDAVTVTATGSITDVGTAENTYEIEWGTAKKDNYKITDNTGTLEVTQNTSEITLKAASSSKEYDGTALKDESVSVDGELPADHSFTFVVTGSQTDVGSSANTVSSFKVLNADEKDVTAFFQKITTEDGTLEVTKNTSDITFKAPSGSKTYDGTALKPGSVTAAGLPEGFFFTATAGGSQTDAGSSESTVASYKVLNSDEKDVTAYFSNVKTEKGTLTVNQAAVTVTTGSASREYDGKELTSSEASISGLTDADKAVVTVTATGKITEVGTADNNYSIVWGTAKKDNYKITDNTGTLEVTQNTSEITLKTGSSSKAYDGTALKDESVSVDGELPADHSFTFEVTGSQTDVGSSANTISSYKVLNADEKDVTEFFTKIRTEEGTLTVTENNTAITFTSASASKDYDGTPLSDASVTVTGLPEGFTYQASAKGKITDVGSSANEFDIFSSSTIHDEHGVITIVKYGSILKGDKDVTEYFTNVSMEEGTLTVTPAAVTVTTESKSKAYDGSPLKGTVSVTGLADADKDKVTVTATASITDVGSTESTYSFSWGTAKSSNYTLSESIGTLEVTKNNTEITFTSASAEKAYDGTPLIVTDVTVDGLPEGFTYICSGGGPFGVSPDAGTYDNYFNDMTYSYTDENGNELEGWRYAVIKNADGKDVTDYFTNINLVKGKLTIHPLTVSVDLKNPVFDYDGRTHGSGVPELKYENGPKKGESVTPSTIMSNDAGGFKGEYILSDGVTMTVHSGGEGPDAGTYTLSCSQDFSDDANTANYKVNVTGNTLTINKSTAVVTTGSAEGPSGTMYPVTSDEASITGLADTDKEYVTITATGEQWSVGSSDNTYSIEWGTDDHPVNKDNYIIKEELGTLTMFNAVITPPDGSAKPSKKDGNDKQIDNTSDTGSTSEKETSTEKDTAAGSSDGSTASDQNTAETDDASKKSEQTAEQPGQTSESTDSEKKQPGQTSENTESESDQASENADSKDGQSDRTTESSEKASGVSEESAKETSEVSKKDAAEASKKDTSQESKKDESKETESKKSEPAENKKSEIKEEKKSEEKKSENSEIKKTEKAEAKDSDNSEKKNARKDSDDGNEAAPAELPTVTEKKDQKDSEE